MNKEERTNQMLAAGVKIAQKSGVASVTRSMIAEKCGVTPALVSHNLGNVADMHAKLRKHAKRTGVDLPAKADEAKLRKQVNVERKRGGARTGSGRPSVSAAARAPKAKPSNA